MSAFLVLLVPLRCAVMRVADVPGDCCPHLGPNVVLPYWQLSAALIEGRHSLILAIRRIVEYRRTGVDPLPDT